MVNVWVEDFVESVKNAAIAAAASEAITSSLADRTKYAAFNSLIVTNRDAVDIEVRLDGLATRPFTVPANTVLIISPADGIYFSFFTQTNLHASTTETVDTILFRWAKAKLVA